MSKTDTATSDRTGQSLWRRLAPFLDVLGAVLIFGSWILSHTLSQRAQEQAGTHQGIITDVREFRLYDDFAQRISSIQSDLVRTRSLVEYGRLRGEVLDGKVESLPDTLTWTGMTAAQVRELDDFLESLHGYAGRLSASDTRMNSIEALQTGAGSLSQTFDSARNEFDRLVERQNSATAQEDLVATAREGEELRKRVDLLWQEYDTAKHSLLDVGDELLRIAATESNSASQLAWRCEQLSWVLYVVGTLTVLFGRAKSVLAAKKADEQKANVT